MAAGRKITVGGYGVALTMLHRLYRISTYTGSVAPRRKMIYPPVGVFIYFIYSIIKAKGHKATYIAVKYIQYNYIITSIKYVWHPSTFYLYLAPKLGSDSAGICHDMPLLM